jgi:hypothetical protein
MDGQDIPGDIHLNVLYFQSGRLGLDENERSELAAVLSFEPSTQPVKAWKQHSLCNVGLIQLVSNFLPVYPPAVHMILR